MFLLHDRTLFILVCFFAIFWQWKQPVLNTKYYSQLAWEFTQGNTGNNGDTNRIIVDDHHHHQPLLGVTVVITGVTSGLGLGIAKNLFQMGATIVAVGRSSTKLNAVKNLFLNMDPPPLPPSLTNDATTTERVHTFIADFTDLNSVSKAADLISSQFSSLDYLINNAGMYHAATTEIATKQRHEIVFGVNYLAHVLWTNKLLPLLLLSNKKKNEQRQQEEGFILHQKRIIQISSTMHGAVDGTDLFSSVIDPPIASLPLNTIFQKSRSYSNSKLAQIYHTRALNRELAMKNQSCSSSSSSNAGSELSSLSSCVQVINVCPSWVGTSISASSFAELIMRQLGYEAEGFGVASTLYAMFHPNASTILDYVSNNRNFASTVRPATKFLGSYPWLDSSNVRVKLWTWISLVLLVIEKFIPDTGFVDTSEESYNVTKQDALYAWSLKAIQPFL